LYNFAKDKKRGIQKKVKPTVFAQFFSFHEAEKYKIAYPVTIKRSGSGWMREEVKGEGPLSGRGSSQYVIPLLGVGAESG
jgi:hypothetical protein